MRILINLHGFSPGSGGVETYLVNLVEALQRNDRSNEYCLFGDRRMEELFPLSAANFHFVAKDYSGDGWRGWIRTFGLRLHGIDLLGHHLKSWGADVIHHPLTVLNPPGLSVPAVLTFHDMQQESYPEFFPAGELRKRSKQYRASVKEAQAVVAISAYVKKGLVERYGVEPEKVHVVHHGIHSNLRRVTDGRQLNELRSRYSLARPFFIYPAATWPHKNHLHLLKALRLLMDRNGFDGELVLTGAVKQEEEAVGKAIADLHLETHVRRLGYVREADMPGLLSLARMLVFPSLYEGFGLPVIEAMACGCPVACSNVTSLPEVASDAAIYFDPQSIDEIAKGIGELWNNDRLRGELHGRGLVNVQRFSWEKAAEQTLAVYRTAANINAVS